MGGGCGVDGVNGWWLRRWCRWCRWVVAAVISSPPSSGKWAAKRKLMMRVGPLDSVLGKWGKTSWDKKDGKSKPSICASRSEDFQTLTMNWRESSPPSSGKWAARKELAWRRDAKKINVHPEWKDSQTLTNRIGVVWVESSPPSSGKWAAKRKPMNWRESSPPSSGNGRLDGKLFGLRRMTKKINVHPEWKTLQTLTNELACLDGKLLGTRRMTKKINVHPEWKTLQTLTNELACLDGKLLGPRRMTKKINVHPEWKTLQTLTNELACLDGKLLGPRRMTKKINVHPEWKTLQTLTNELACLDGKLLGPRRMTKKINVHPEWLILQTLTNGAKGTLDHPLLSSGKWAEKKIM
ncbi:hypothetical protein Tco_0461067 [Tanacetum coccineum]